MSPVQHAKAQLLTRKDTHGAAQAAGLRYVNVTDPGITRSTRGVGWNYTLPNGKPVKDAATLDRIRKLAIPPAWTEVWVCTDPRGHIQATGKDAKGRKQYRYHGQWREVRDETKYHRILDFGRALPALRERVLRDMARPGLPREKVLAAVVRLLERTFIRIGNDAYAKENQHYGLTTMHDGHVKIHGKTMEFKFTGKSGVDHHMKLDDPKLAKVVKACQALPGQELLQYLDHEGKVRDIKSDDVNAYLQEVSGADYTAKDFRTWAGTVLAAMALQELGPFTTKAQCKRNLNRAVKAVSTVLGNTPAVCKKSYVHPEVVAAYTDGELVQDLQRELKRVSKAKAGSLRPEEAAVLALLRHRLGAERRKRKGLPAA